MTPSTQKRAGDPEIKQLARASLLLLLLINLFNYIDRYLLAAVMPDIEKTFFSNGAVNAGPGIAQLIEWFRHTFGFTPNLALGGLLSTAFILTYMILAPVFGHLAHKYSRWALVGVGIGVWSFATGASGLAGTFLALLITRCFVGVGEAAYGPVAPAMISDLYPIEERGRVLSWFYTALPVGSALGYVLGEQIAKSGIGAWGAGFLSHLGVTSADSWRWAFFVVLPPGIVLAVWSFFMRDPARSSNASKKEIPLRQYAIFFKTPSFVLCNVGMTFMTFAMGGIAVWMPFYLEHKPGSHGYPTTIFGGVLLVTGLLGTLIGGWLGDRLRKRWSGSYFLVSGVTMLIAVPMVWHLTYITFPWIWGYIFFACLCLFVNTAPANTILANVTHPSMRAAGYALNILVIHALGDVLSPLVMGLIADKWSMDIAFRTVAVVMLLSGVTWIFGAKYLARDTERAEHLLDEGATAHG